MPIIDASSPDPGSTRWAPTLHGCCAAKFTHRAGTWLEPRQSRLDIPELVPLYDEFRDMEPISISDAQRAPQPQASWLATVYHGLPLDLHRFEPSPRDYLAFVGRVSPEKRLDRAIEIATRA